MNTKTIHLTATVLNEHTGKRLDQVLALLFPEYSRSCLQSWVRAKQVKVDNKPYKQSEKVKVGQEIVIDAELEPIQSWKAQPIQLDIIHEDPDLIVINKQPGLVVHPGAGNPDKTLVNALLHHDPSLNLVPRAGIIHRIDKDTSGLLVVARNLETHNYLVNEMQQHLIKREYEAVVYGVLISGGTIDLPIGRHPKNRLKMAVVSDGKSAITHYRVIERFRAHTHIRVELETGRTHQIRVHMAHMHHPVVGDPLYAGREHIPAKCGEELRSCLKSFKRQALHAKKLSFVHPRSGELVSFTAPMPEDMQHLLDCLKTDAL